MEGDHEGDAAKKPRHLTRENADNFLREGVARHYPLRPPYPRALIDRLAIGGVVLEMGCGTGEVARRIAPRVARVDAVDPSEAMIARGRGLPGGDHPNLRWIRSRAEEFSYDGPYDLVVTAQSLHWMEWEAVLPAFARALAPAAELAIVPSGWMEVPWRAEIKAAVPEYSTMWNYEAYDLVDLLSARGLFRCRERVTFGPEPFSQTVDDYVGAWWSRASFARAAPDVVRAFEARVRAIVEPHARDGRVEGQLFAELALGTPVDPRT